MGACMCLLAPAHVFVCVGACLGACVRVHVWCMCVYVCVCRRACVGACVGACVVAYVCVSGLVWVRELARVYVCWGSVSE